MVTQVNQDKQSPINYSYPFKSQFDHRTLIFIYQISCKDPNVKENYIGQTESFENRKYAHSRNCKTSDLKIYKTIRRYGGWDNWEMKIMNHYYCKDEYEARQIEQKYMDIFKVTMNSVRAYSKSFIDQELDRQLEFEINDFSDRILGCYLYDYYLELDFDQEMECNFCKKTFSLSSLNNHKVTAKYCLKIQKNFSSKKKDKKPFKCEYCNKILSTNQMLQYHNDSCDQKKIFELKLHYENIIENLKKEFSVKEKEYQNKIADLECYIEHLMKYKSL